MFLKMSSTSKGKQLECLVQCPQLAQTVPQKQGQMVTAATPCTVMLHTCLVASEEGEKKRSVKSQVVSTATQIGTSS